QRARRIGRHRHVACGPVAQHGGEVGITAARGGVAAAVFVHQVRAEQAVAIVRAGMGQQARQRVGFEQAIGIDEGQPLGVAGTRWFQASEKPGWSGLQMKRRRGSSEAWRWTTSRLPSVEPLSTTRTCTTAVQASSRARQSAMVASLWWLTTIAAMPGAAALM